MGASHRALPMAPGVLTRVVKRKVLPDIALYARPCPTKSRRLVVFNFFFPLFFFFSFFPKNAQTFVFGDPKLHKERNGKMGCPDPERRGQSWGQPEGGSQPHAPRRAPTNSLHFPLLSF